MICYKLSDGSDNSSVLQILCQIDKSFPIPLSEKIKLDELADKLTSMGYVYLAIEEDRAVGIMGFYANDHVDKAAYISVLGVLESHQGRGIAKNLIERALKLCKDNGMEKAILFTHGSNTGAIKMYEKLGFSSEFDPKRPEDIKFNISL